MKKLISLLIILIFVTANFAQEKRAITVDDLWNMKRIGSFDVSSDASKIIFDLTTYDMESNKGQTDIYLINSDGTNLKKIVESASSPQFFDGGSKILYSKNSQIYTNNLFSFNSAHLTDTYTAEYEKNEMKLTDIYTGVSGAEFSIDESMLLFSSSVYPECKTQECNEKKDKERDESKVKAEIFTELMYRHWNDWRGPKISHLFLFDIEKK
jgi:dipeptidyl aminopeptidase/acylaminoacyl peptidase